MPIYTYDCAECKHETESFSGISSRQEEIECEECGSNAKHRKLNWRPPPKIKNRHPKYGKGTPSADFMKKERLIQYCCVTCHRGTFDWFKGDAPKTVDCEYEECAGEANRVYKVKLDMHWARFPYYDRGLGVTLTSESHRTELCRQRGLTPVDGDWDLDAEIKKNEAIVEEEKEVYRDYYDRVQNDSAYADLRKAQDNGLAEALLPPD